MNAVVESSARRPEDLLGLVLKNCWRLDSVLGVGGMATVYAATARDGSRVALKLLDPELARDPGIRARFLREALVANAVGHRGVVRIHHQDEDPGGAAFLIMELLDGEPLDAVLRRSGERLPPLEVFRMADQVLDVLAAAHAQRIIHRDIKPQNLFLTREGELKVLDFGIARVMQARGPSRITEPGAVLGTIAYMAPEQACGHGGLVDARTDLWALGSTMFRLLTGQFVHQAGSDLALWEAAVTRRARSIATVMPWLPGAAAFVIDEALRFDREHRWPDARAMQGALREARPLLQQGLCTPASACEPGSGLSTSADQPTIPASRRMPLRSCG